YKALIRKRIRTTNVIERAFREVRRRARPISGFTNEDSVNRIIYAVITRLNNNWLDTPLKEFTQFI
ncbi:MAG: transposase, partial [Candidatus Omnitrophica bacterium]|nr:transposase [Candidatus Omnitrophota bacterium]